VDGSSCSNDGFHCSPDGFIHLLDGSICSTDGFICLPNGFFCSADGRNWWVDALSSSPAVNITFRQATTTFAGPAFCSGRVKLTVDEAGRDSILSNSVSASAPLNSQRARKTISRVNKTIADSKNASMDVTFTDL
jgi:hypothetical protein